MGAASLLGFPVAQGGLAEIHAAYLSLSGEIKKKDRQARVHVIVPNNSSRLTVLAGYPPEALNMRQWRNYRVPCTNSRDVFGDDIY